MNKIESRIKDKQVKNNLHQISIYNRKGNLGHSHTYSKTHFKAIAMNILKLNTITFNKSHKQNTSQKKSDRST